MQKKALILQISVVIATALLILGGLSGCGKKSGQDSTEIRIAVPVAMTGKFTEYGMDLINAAQMAIDEKNASGGIKGKKIVLVKEDDKGDPKDAVTVAHKIVQDSGIIGIMGHLNSGTTLAASPIYSEAGISVVMPVPTNPEITRQGFNNLFRVPITDDLQGTAAYEFLVAKVGKKALAIVHNRETYGLGIAEEFRKALERDGGTPVFFEGVTANEQDYRPVIVGMRSAGAEGIFFGGEYADAARFIRQVRELGIEVPIVMGDGCFNTEMAKIAGDAVRNCYVANIAPINAPNPRAQKFYDEFKQKYEKIVAYAPLGYVATQILLDAMEKSSDITRESVRATLNSPDYSYESILGTFEFTPEGDSKGRKIFWHQLRNGEFEAIAAEE
jgi:branched-chain amino acid transport system substrate-binding protein